MPVTLADIIAKETEATFSDIARDLKNAVWVRSRAREVELFSEYSVVEKLALIMSEFRRRYDWAAVSSNNVYWNLTDSPIRVIQIPDPDYYMTPDSELQHDNFLTIVNPEIIDKQRHHFDGRGEGCGSLGESRIPVYRYEVLRVKGYVLERERTDIVSTSNPILAAYIQHEMDHLEGKIIADFGPVFNLKCSNEFLLEEKHNPMHWVSASFEYVWPTRISRSKNRLIHLPSYDRCVLIDEFYFPTPTLSFVLNHDEKEQPYWSIFEAKKWLLVENENEFKYGKLIVFEFADTPEFRTILNNLPEIKSRYNFWKIPIRFAE